MKFLIDENTTPVLCGTLNTYFGSTHSFAHVREAGWAGTADLELFARARDHGFDALITQDRNQWSNSSEQQGIRDSGLSWLAHTVPDFGGPKQVAFLTAMYLAALDEIVNAARQGAVYCRVKGIGHGQGERVKFLR